MTIKRLLEVESKFLFDRSLLTTFTSNKGNPPFHSLIDLGTHRFTDTYFDHHNTLSTNGIWLRHRVSKQTSTLEAKVRVSGTFQRSTFHELTDRPAIRHLVRQHLPHYHDDDEERDNYGLEQLARFTTTRREWRADGRFGIVLDESDFGHRVGEVEVMSEEGGKAREEIDAFMERYGWFFGKGKPEGKLAAFLRLEAEGRLS